MDLFSQIENKNLPGTPLAERLRPQNIDEVWGQEKAIGFNSALSQLLKSGHIPSAIIWGPPGTGKTTFARTLASQVDAEFVSLHAVDSGAKDLKRVGDEAKKRRTHYQRRTLVFVDEIHRFNKAQQDVLLPFVEGGDFILIGATTENPSYELNNALMSRCRLVVFERLQAETFEKMLEKALASDSLKREEFLTKEAEQTLIELADGDGRQYYNFLEQVISVHHQELKSENSPGPITGERLLTILGHPARPYDRNSDFHYDIISAFIKAIRGSDPDAALYYLARMLSGGEDPKFIARRLVILASEDIGNADPRALTLTVSTFQAVELIGLPEARINLAQATTYLASAPKSNAAYMGIKKAEEAVQKTGSLPVPKSLRSSNTSLMKSIGYGADYKYSHDGDRGWVDQDFLPPELKSQTFYYPKDHGFEKNIKQYLEWLKQK